MRGRSRSGGGRSPARPPTGGCSSRRRCCFAGSPPGTTSCSVPGRSGPRGCTSATTRNWTRRPPGCYAERTCRDYGHAVVHLGRYLHEELESDRGRDQGCAGGSGCRSCRQRALRIKWRHRVGRRRHWYVEDKPELREAAMASREALGGHLADRDWMARVLDETYARMDEPARVQRYPFPLDARWPRDPRLSPGAPSTWGPNSKREILVGYR